VRAVAASSADSHDCGSVTSSSSDESQGGQPLTVSGIDVPRITFALSSTNSRACAAPIPTESPVITATLPHRRDLGASLAATNAHITNMAAYACSGGGLSVERAPRASLFGGFGATSRLRPAGWLARSNSAVARSTPLDKTSMSLELS
jgi:hypothetical protein